MPNISIKFSRKNNYKKVRKNKCIKKLKLKITKIELKND